jgi:methionyl-tRNA formyltransferase
VKLVFFGTPQVAAVSLGALRDAGHEVALVVTQPDRPAGRSRTPAASPVKRLALAAGIAVEQPEKLRDPAFLARLAGVAPELSVVVAYGRLLPDRLLELAPRGAINVHFSLLPRYRGAAPVQWALARGESSTGVTTMRIVQRLDAGEILLQREVAIEADEHAPALQERLAALGADLLLRTLEGLAAGTLEPRAQDEAQATHAPVLTARDGEIDPAWSAREIAGRVRGFDPWPGAWLARPGRRLRITRARERAAAAASDAAVGSVIGLGAGAAALVCGGGTLLELLRVQPEGRREMSIAEALNGRNVTLGERFGGDILEGHG